MKLWEVPQGIVLLGRSDLYCYALSGFISAEPLQARKTNFMRIHDPFQ